jgi:hypothetical protein
LFWRLWVGFRVLRVRANSDEGGEEGGEAGRRGSESRAQGPIVKGEKRTHELQSLQAL